VSYCNSVEDPLYPRELYNLESQLAAARRQKNALQQQKDTTAARLETITSEFYELSVCFHTIEQQPVRIWLFGYTEFDCG